MDTRRKTKKTNEEYVKEVYELVGDEYSVIDEYVDARTKIAMLHNVCGRMWDVSPNNFLRGRRCSHCFGKKLKSHEKYLQEVYALVGDEYTVLGKYVNSKTKILMKHNTCMKKWEIEPSVFIYGHRCPYCSGNMKLTHEEHILRMALMHNTIECLEEYKTNNTPIKHRCLVCGYNWLAKPDHLYRGAGCLVCAGRAVLKGFNDLWTTAPNSALLLKDPLIGFEVTKGSHRREMFVCNICGFEKEYQIKALVGSGFACNQCGIRISYPNKVMFALLKATGLDFTPEKIFDWSCGKVYDFWIPLLNCIIECHGGQHYEGNFYHLTKQTVAEVQENDKFKQDNARLNNVANYVIVDCRKSSFDFIKNSIINSELSNLLNLSDIDWDSVEKASLINSVREAVILRNNGYKIVDIANILKVHTGTVYSYLRRAQKAGLSVYTRKKSVVCLTTGIIFDSLKNAAKNYGLVSGDRISQCCQGRTNYCGKLPDGTKLKWMYYTDYLAQNPNPTTKEMSA